MSPKRWIALAIAAVLLFVSIGFQFITSLASTNLEGLFVTADDGIEERVLEQGTSGEKIVVIDVEGVIQDTGDASSFMMADTYNHRMFLRMLERAGERQDVDGIILRVNTPGGGVVESEEIHDKIVAIREETGKPIYVSMGNTAASGGYYIAAPADKIVAHPATITGSIGVIIQTMNFSELAENIGIDFTTIKSGPYKDILSANREMTDEEKGLLQEMVNDFYDDFVSVIVNGRGMSEETVRELGDGRVYSGKQAKEVNLVDELGTLEDTIDLLSEDQGWSHPTVVRYRAGAFGFNQFLGASLQSLIVSDTELLGIKEILSNADTPRAMYLYTE